MKLIRNVGGIPAFFVLFFTEAAEEESFLRFATVYETQSANVTCGSTVCLGSCFLRGCRLSHRGLDSVFIKISLHLL